MAIREETDEEKGDDRVAVLELALASIVDEARAAVAAGDAPDFGVLQQRVRDAAHGERPAGAEAARRINRAEADALQRLDRVATVARARAMVTREPPVAAATPPPPPRPTLSLRSRLRARPTITANMDVRREPTAEGVALAWDGAAAVVGWEVRVSERPDPRADYVVVEERSFPPGEATVEVALGDVPRRVNILGRSRDGRLLRRALISSLTAENRDDRWERRASAS